MITTYKCPAGFNILHHITTTTTMTDPHHHSNNFLSTKCFNFVPLHPHHLYSSNSFTNFSIQFQPPPPPPPHPPLREALPLLNNLNLLTNNNQTTPNNHEHQLPSSTDNSKDPYSSSSYDQAGGGDETVTVALRIGLPFKAFKLTFFFLGTLGFLINCLIVDICFKFILYFTIRL